MAGRYLDVLNDFLPTSSKNCMPLLIYIAWGCTVKLTCFKGHEKSKECEEEASGLFIGKCVLILQQASILVQ